MRSRQALSVPTSTGTTATLGTSRADQAHADALDWSWPPYAPVETSAGPFETPEWAPASSVEHPLLRLGRWTVLYRRSA